MIGQRRGNFLPLPRIEKRLLIDRLGDHGDPGIPPPSVAGDKFPAIRREIRRTGLDSHYLLHNSLDAAAGLYSYWRFSSGLELDGGAKTVPFVPPA